MPARGPACVDAFCFKDRAIIIIFIYQKICDSSRTSTMWHIMDVLQLSWASQAACLNLRQSATSMHAGSCSCIVHAFLLYLSCRVAGVKGHAACRNASCCSPIANYMALLLLDFSCGLAAALTSLLASACNILLSSHLLFKLAMLLLPLPLSNHLCWAASSPASPPHQGGPLLLLLQDFRKIGGH